MILLKRAAKAIVPYGIMASYKRRIERKDDPHYIHHNNVAIYPIVPDGANTYIDLLKRSLKAAGYNPVDSTDEAEYIWLHWYENNLDEKKFPKKIEEIRAWQKQGRKVIFHVHNRRPHEHTDTVLVNTFMSTVVRVVDHVSIISSETYVALTDMWHYGNKFRDVSVVPHPNYIDVYGERLDDTSRLSDDTLNILFFGLVRPYKGVEHLIEATKGLKSVKVGIYGRAPSDEYKARLGALCEGRDDVELEVRHIEDSEIPTIFSRHHLMAAPYNLDSSLNSGAALLAFSYGRTVAGTNNGTLKDIDDDFYFTYDYKDEADHVNQLRKTIVMIQERYDGKYNELLSLGDAGYAYVETNNSEEAVTKAIKTMFWRVNR